MLWEHEPRASIINFFVSIELRKHDYQPISVYTGNLILLSGTVFNTIIQSYSHTVCQCLGLDHPNK